MKLRLLLVAAIASATVFVGVAPARASSCMPDEGSCCNEGPVPALYKKLTGEDLFHCPW